MKKFNSGLVIIGFTLCALAAYSNVTLAAPDKEKAKTVQMNMQKINLNTATVEQLLSLPGIGEKKASAIVDYRQKNGKFKSLEDLTAVKGIGMKMLEKLRGKLVAS
ncbi:MAG: competence protein ComEA [Paraglaciecola sp.]|jgi:competence protein ComEA